MKRHVQTLLLCALLCAAACSTPQVRTVENNATTAGPTTANSSSDQSATTSADETAAETQEGERVKVSAHEVQLTVGGSAEAVVRLEIADGYHVNANPPSDKFYIGTEVQAEAQGGVAPGKPVYPRGLTKKFQFSAQPLAVYEGRAVVRLPLRADAAAAKGRKTFRARVRYQPCNDRECLQPRTLEVAIPVNVS